MRRVHLGFGAALAALFAQPVAAGAEKVALTPYVVQPKDNCSRIAKKLYGDSRYIELIHQNNALGPKPHRLRAGQVLRVPPRATEAPQRGPDATLTFVRNQVEAYTPEYHRGQKDEPLRQGHRVSTLDQSSAEITFRDESQITLGEHTLVIVFGDGAGEAQASRRPRTGETTLLRGALLARLGELSGEPPPPLVTPGARVTFAPGASEARVHVDDKRATRLSVYRGASKLGSGGRAVSVPSGFGSRADLGRRPTPPRPLPGAPRLHVPGLRLTAGAPGPVDIEGQIEPAGSGPRPASYRVQLARDERMNDLLVDARVAASPGARLQARAVPPGDYFARVSAIDGDEFQGPPSATARVRVVHIGHALEPVATGAGAGEARGRVELPAGLRCTLDGQAVAGAAVQAVPTRPHVLRCAAAGSEKDAAELTLPVLREEPEPPPAPLVAVAEPPPPVPVQIPAPPRRWFALVAPRIGARLGPSRSLGLGVGGEIGVLRSLPLGGIALAARVDYEPAFGSRPPPASAPALLQAQLAVLYLFGQAQRATFVPYLGIAPSLLVRLVPGQDAVRDAALAGFAGMQLRVGPGGFFFEGGYRGVLTESGTAAGLASASSGSVLLGYRFVF